MMDNKKTFFFIIFVDVDKEIIFVQRFKICEKSIRNTL